MRNCIIFILIVLSNSVFSKERTRNDALKIANDFIAVNKSTVSYKSASVHQPLELAFELKDEFSDGQSINRYYIFNKGSESGFIIISGDDRAEEVLAYSDEGTFNEKAIPDNLKYWLSQYEYELRSLDRLAEESLVNDLTKSGLAGSNFVQPLLANIRWGQEAPYNSKCPIVDTESGERALTGCVITAYTQIMKYHKWPDKAVGSNTYTTATLGLTLTNDFSTYSFDWSKIAGNYSGQKSDEEKDAVGNLMYAFGTSINADYGKYGTNASIAYGINSLKNNFSYNSGIKLLNRYNFSNSEWLTMIKNELNSKRPVIYSGYSQIGGHAFVIDGYDSDDFIHINWGWSGFCNGYFKLTATNPEATITNDYSNEYNIVQQMIIGIQKEELNFDEYETDSISLMFGIYVEEDSIAKTDSFHIKAPTVYITSETRSDIYYCLGIYNESDSLVDDSNKTFYSNNYLGAIGTANSWPIKINEDLPIGEYYMIPLYRDVDSTTWSKVIINPRYPQSMKMIIREDDILFPSNSSEMQNLTCDIFKVSNPWYSNRAALIKFDINNKDSLSFNNYVHVLVESITDPKLKYVFNSKYVNIDKGEKKHIEFINKLAIPEGEYKASIRYLGLEKFSLNQRVDILADSTNQAFIIDSLNFTVLAKTTEDADFYAVDPILFNLTKQEDKSVVDIGVRLKNNGSFYRGKLTFYIFNIETDRLQGTIENDSVFEINENEIKQFNYSFPIDLPNGNYIIYTLATDTKEIDLLYPKQFASHQFTYTSDVTTGVSINATVGFSIFPNPATNYVTIKLADSNKSSSFKLYDLQGSILISKYIDNDEKVNLEGIENGIYLYEISNGVNRKNGKILKRD